MKTNVISVELKKAALAAKKANGSEIILVIGPTGAGKSTFISSMVGDEISLISKDRSGKKHYGVSGGKESAKISDRNVSETKEPQLFPLSDTSFQLCDTPGLRDTNGTEFRVSTGVGIKLTAQASKSVVGIIVLIDLTLFLSNRAVPICDFFDDLEKLFSDINTLSNINFTFCLTKPENDAVLEELPSYVLSHFNENYNGKFPWLENIFKPEGPEKNVFVVNYNTDGNKKKFSPAVIVNYFSKPNLGSIPKDQINAFIDDNTRLKLKEWISEVYQKACGIFSQYSQIQVHISEKNEKLSYFSSQISEVDEISEKQNLQLKQLEVQLQYLNKEKTGMYEELKLANLNCSEVSKKTTGLSEKISELKSVKTKVIAKWKPENGMLEPGDVYVSDICLRYQAGDQINIQVHPSELISKKYIPCADGSFLFIAKYECNNAQGKSPKPLQGLVQVIKSIKEDPLCVTTFLNGYNVAFGGDEINV